MAAFGKSGRRCGRAGVALYDPSPTSTVHRSIRTKSIRAGKQSPPSTMSETNYSITWSARSKNDSGIVGPGTKRANTEPIQIGEV
jgi:hypothetical protein